MKILFITRLFYPSNQIGSVRTSNFAIGLSNLSNKVICVTGNEKAVAYGTPSLRIIAINDFIPSNSDAHYFSKSSRLIKGIKRIVPSVLKKSIFLIKNHREEKKWASMVLFQLLNTIDFSTIDLVFTSYGPLSSILIGKELKRKYSGIPWICDMRDPMDSCTVQLWYRIYLSALQRSAMKLCNHVITVSDDITHFFSVDASKITVIPNGFEGESNTVPTPADGVLRIGYTGSLYEGRSRIDIIFDVLATLKKSQTAPFEFHYAGPDSAAVQFEAKKRGLSSQLVDHGLLSRLQAGQVQEQCDILCVLTWNTRRGVGILTGKFPEYLRMNRLILGIVSGDVTGSELKRRVEQLNVGFVCELADNQSFCSLEKWLQSKASEKKLGRIKFCGNQKEIDKYKYSKLIQSLNEILLDYNYH